MRQTRAVEFGTGLFALLGIAAIFFLATQTTGGFAWGTPLIERHPGASVPTRRR